MTDKYAYLYIDNKNMEINIADLSYFDNISIL
jgi:hypothetical protein